MPPMGSTRRNFRHSGFSKVRYVQSNRTSTGQCCGSRMFIPDPETDFFPSRIRIFPSRIPGPHQRIKPKNPNPKKLFLSSRKYDPGCSSRIRILTFYPSGIQGSKGNGSRIRISNTATGKHCRICSNGLIVYKTWDLRFSKSNKRTVCNFFTYTMVKFSVEIIRHVLRTRPGKVLKNIT
jgi:hypothetical protein